MRHQIRWSPNATVSMLAMVLIAGLVRHNEGDPPNTDSLHGTLESAALVAAMMMPLAGASARAVAQRSLRDRRLLAVIEHVAAFATVWFVFGVSAATAIGVMANELTTIEVFGVFTAVAAAWQLSARRRQFVERCGRLPTAPPTGWRSDVGTALAGMHQAVRCVRTCWASMLAMAAAPHVAVMAIMFGAYLSEWAPGANPLARIRRYRPVPAYLGLAFGSFVAVVARLRLVGDGLA